MPKFDEISLYVCDGHKPNRVDATWKSDELPPHWHKVNGKYYCASCHYFKLWDKNEAKKHHELHGNLRMSMDWDD